MTLLSWDGQVLPKNENTKIILYTERKCKRIMKMWALKLDCHGWNPVPVFFSDVALKVKVLATQSCPTLCNFTDCSPPGSSVHRLGSWVWPCVWCVLSHVWLFATPWTIALQAPLPMGLPRQEYWSGLLLQRIFSTHGSNQSLLHLLYWQVDPLPLHHLGSPMGP